MELYYILLKNDDKENSADRSHPYENIKWIFRSIFERELTRPLLQNEYDTKTGKGGKKKGGSNRRVVELNARVEKKDQLAIHHASIPPSSLARIRNQLTVRLFQRGVARTSEKTGKSGTIQKRDKMINRRG